MTTPPTDRPNVRLRLAFFGRVQGVGFRATARDIARGFEVTGWVRNEADGSVSMEIQGQPSEIAACLDHLRARMKHHITRESELPLQPLAGEVEFTIER